MFPIVNSMLQTAKKQFFFSPPTKIPKEKEKFLSGFRLAVHNKTDWQGNRRGGKNFRLKKKLIKNKKQKYRFFRMISHIQKQF